MVCPALLGGGGHEEPDGADMAQGESAGATGQWDVRLARIWFLVVLEVGTAKVGAGTLWAGGACCPGAGELSDERV